MSLLDWILTDKVRAAADLVFNGGKLTQADARTALTLLQDESPTHIRARVGTRFYNSYFPTKRHGGAWKSEAPSGWVDHYTAGTSAKRTLKWFSSRDRGPGVGNSCSHFLMDHDGTVIVLVNPLTTVTWHATWANRTHLGIEHINAGRLTKNKAGAFLYMGKLLYPVKDEKPVQEIAGKFWEPYTTAQLVSNIVLKRLVYLAIPTLDPTKFVDHEIIDPKRKQDCGPLWPLEALNRLVFSWKNANAITVLFEKDVLLVEDVTRFNSEVAQLTASIPSHASS